MKQSYCILKKKKMSIKTKNSIHTVVPWYVNQKVIILIHIISPNDKSHTLHAGEEIE